MSQQDPWIPIEPDWETILERYPNPIQALAEMRTPAPVIRQAYNPAHCEGLTQRFIEKDLMYDQDTLYNNPSIVPTERIDIGTSLGNRGNSPEDFFSHAEETHTLFETLFDGFDNPVSTLYENLARLAPGKRIVTAYEPDGRCYGPAIFRIHYHTQVYKPHIDSVRLREERTDYAVYRFEHQFAGVLCMQNADELDTGTQSILHRCLWTEEVQPYIAEDTFDQYTAENGIEKCRVELSPGDLYFFNTRCIHEVPPVQGNNPRIVLAAFIGYSPDDDEIFVWS
jgi:hypothetical protein